jgi:hypothetical protein
VQPEKSLLSSTKFAPNPVKAELRRVGASARRPQLNNDTPVATHAAGHDTRGGRRKVSKRARSAWPQLISPFRIGSLNLRDAHGRPARQTASFRSKDDAALGQIIGRHFDQHPIPYTGPIGGRLADTRRYGGMEPRWQGKCALNRTIVSTASACWNARVACDVCAPKFPGIQWRQRPETRAARILTPHFPLILKLYIARRSPRSHPGFGLAFGPSCVGALQSCAAFKNPAHALSNGNCGRSSGSACRMHVRWEAALNGRLRRRR